MTKKTEKTVALNVMSNTLREKIDTLQSASNKKSAQAALLALSLDRVVDFLVKCNVRETFASDFYLAQHRLIRFANNITSAHVSARDFESNSVAAFKTVLLTSESRDYVTRAQLHACIDKTMKLNDDDDKLTYRRLTICDALRQKDLNVKMLRALNVCDFKDSKENLVINRESHALNVARDVLKDMIV